MNAEHIDDGLSDLVLDSQNIVQSPIESSRPELTAIARVDHARTHTQSFAAGANAPLQHTSHIQCRANLPNVLHAASKLER